MGITTITIVAKGRIKLTLTLRLIIQMGRGRLRAVNRLGERPVCPICNRRHGGECWGNKPKCYKCGQLGHLKKDCPVKDTKEGQAKLNAVNVGRERMRAASKLGETSRCARLAIVVIVVSVGVRTQSALFVDSWDTLRKIDQRKEQMGDKPN